MRRLLGGRLVGLALCGLALVSAPIGATAQTVDPTATPTAGVDATATATATPTATFQVSPTVTPVPTATPSPVCAEDASDAEQADGVSLEDQLQEAWSYQGEGGGPRNVVKLNNKTSGQLRVRGNVQLNRIKGDSVDPFNYAIAYNSCGYRAATLAVALQVNVYAEGAPYLAPENYAYAVNYGCEACAALAFAVQLSYPVADPSSPPAEVSALVTELDRELRAIHSDQQGLTLGQAFARVKAVVDRFKVTIPAAFAEAQYEAPAP